ncbi:MAG: anion permease [Candidatus Erginobacter occultus]|nr:anion permease [Candidatus Erginobacter occultus]
MIFRSLFAAGGYKVLGGFYLGWGIGANNAANIFGTAVATNAVRYRLAVILIAVFVIVGALVEGPGLFLSGSARFSSQTDSTLALVAVLAAAITINIVTYLTLPTSTTQAAIGAYMGVAVASAGVQAVEWAKLLRMMIGWLVSPIVGLLLCLLLLKVLGYLLSRLVSNNLTRVRIYKIGFLVFGCYGAYTLGANNVVVTTVAYYDAGMFGLAGSKSAAFWAAALGGVSMALGALTYGGRVMTTIGKKITPLSAFSALVVVLVHSITLHLFTQINIPISSTHAVIGAIMGVGLAHGTKTINRKTIIMIVIGWVATPLVAASSAWGIASLLR